jgi:DNA helicase HerA-like ATPase
MSKCHIIVGATGTGKTTFVKKLLKKASKQSLFIYDVNNEYKEYFNYPFIYFEDFIESATRLKNGILVIEEATIFLNNRSSNENLKEILVRKRHTNLYVILVFHSMRSVPRYIYELSNYITIFKTNDSPDMTSKELKDDRIYDIMTEVKDHKNKYFQKTMKIY